MKESTRCEVVVQHSDRRFEVIRFDAPLGAGLPDCHERAAEIVTERKVKYVTCARLAFEALVAPDQETALERALAKERNVLRARLAETEARLSDARDEVYDLQARITSLETINEEMRTIKGGVRTQR